MVSITMSESIDQNASSKEQEKIMGKLISACPFHNDNKELYICIKCGVAYCQRCATKHNGHETLQRKELINIGKKVRDKSENLNKAFEDCSLPGSFQGGGSDICKLERQQLDENLDDLQKRVDDIKKNAKNVINSFNNHFEAIHPYLLEYKEKLDNLTKNAHRIDTFISEQEFIDYYICYLNVDKKEQKILEQIDVFKKKVGVLKEILKEFISKTQKILDDTDEQYQLLKNIQFYDNSEMLKRSMLNTNTMSFTSSFNRKYGNMNLATMLAPERIKNKYLKNEERSYYEKHFSNQIKSQSFHNSRAIGNNVEEEMGQDISVYDSETLYGIEHKTQNILLYNKSTQKVSKIKINLEGLSFKKFESFLSTLNYDGKFYLSGGLSSSRSLFKLRPSYKILSPLEDMPSKHSYHGMIGIGNCIYCISGIKNKGVEKYNLNQNKWTSLPPLEISRSWPGCLCSEQKYLYVFGGLCDISHNTEINKINRLDITNPSDIWESIEINVGSGTIIPFYCGIVPLENKTFLLLGGKINTRESCISSCFKLTIDNNNCTFEKNEEYILPGREEFNGRMFSDFGNGLFGEFSSFNSNKFYLVNTSSKNIEDISQE